MDNLFFKLMCTYYTHIHYNLYGKETEFLNEFLIIIMID